MNTIRYSEGLTKGINRGLQAGSRPIGKNTRVTTYNNIIRTNLAAIGEKISEARFKFKRSSHAHGTDKWLLEDNRSAHAHNLPHFLFFSQLLSRKQGTSPSLPTLIEFLVFLIRHPTQIQLIGTFVHPTRAPPTPTPPATTTIIHTHSTHHHNPTPDDWLLDDVPNFDDENDIPT